jgi:hypothetical protein
MGLALLAVWIALYVSGRQKWAALRRDWRAEACLLAAVIAYFFLPRSLLKPTYWWGINIRFAVMAALFLALSIRGPIEGWRRWLLAPVVAISLGFVADMTVHIRRAQAFCAGFDRLARLPAPGSRVLFIIGYPWHDPSFSLNYALLYSGFYQAQRGGYMPWNFDDGFPLRYRVRYPTPKWRTMIFNWEQHADYYDYVRVFHNDERIFGGHPVEQVGAEGSWRLYKLPGPRIDEPPGPAYPREWSVDPNWKRK